jgi:hypothetical protein
MRLAKAGNALFFGFLFFIFVNLILQYVVNVKYSFPEPHHFRGETIYNPYSNFDGTKWQIANFHAHAWKPFDGRDKLTHSRALDSLYRYLGYKIISISDYQTINNFESKNEWFIPVYEHGFQYYKNHQLILNAGNVDWHDFPFRQTLNNKQFILDHLKKNPSVITTIVHPVYRKAYSSNDLKYLSNYNCLEIANHDYVFRSCYDTILSYGHPVFLMADDDAHNLLQPEDVGVSFNLVNSDLVTDSVMSALRKGLSVGVKFNISALTGNDQKKAALKMLPAISSVSLRNDTITIGLSQPVKTITFIGQNGMLKKRITGSKEGSYGFTNTDTYIRTEIECNDGTIYFFNPFFRYDGKHLTDYSAAYDPVKTWTWRFAIFILLIFTLLWLHPEKEYVIKRSSL